MPSRKGQRRSTSILFTLDRVGKRLGMGGALVRLDQSKVYDTVDHRYFEAFLAAVSLDLGFHVWI